MGVREGVQVDEVTRRLRQSGVTNLDICLRREWYNQVDYNTGTSDAAAFGTGYHAGMEEFYRLRRDNPDVPLVVFLTPEKVDGYVQSAREAFWEAAHQAGDLMKWNDYSPQSVDPVLDNAVRAYFSGKIGDTETYWPERLGDGLIRVEAVELRFDLPTPAWLPAGWSPSGTADLLLSWVLPGESRPAHLYAEDHKTSGKAWALRKADAREAFQATYYTPVLLDWATTMYGHLYTIEDITWTYGVMRRDGAKFQRLPTPMSEADLARMRAKARAAAEMMDTILDMPNGPAGNPGSNLCSHKYCNHWDVCPWGGGPAVQETPLFINQEKTDNG